MVEVLDDGHLRRVEGPANGHDLRVLLDDLCTLRARESMGGHAMPVEQDEDGVLPFVGHA